jgi:hypothetical protein
VVLAQNYWCSLVTTLQSPSFGAINEVYHVDESNAQFEDVHPIGYAVYLL